VTKTPQTPLVVPIDRAMIDLLLAFGKRLHACMDRSGYPKSYEARYTQLAERYGVSSTTTRKWCRGVALPGPMILLAMANEFHTSVDALIHHDSPIDQPNYKLIPLFKHLDQGGFEKSSGTYVDPEVFQNPGSMGVICWIDSPPLNVKRGDVIFIDTAVRSLAPDGIYLIRDDENVYVCRITRLLKSMLSISYSVQNRDEIVQQPLVLSDITYNQSGALDASPKKGKLLVLGQATWIQKRVL